MESTIPARIDLTSPAVIDLTNPALDEHLFISTDMSRSKQVVLSSDPECFSSYYCFLSPVFTCRKLEKSVLRIFSPIKIIIRQGGFRVTMNRQ